MTNYTNIFHTVPIYHDIMIRDIEGKKVDSVNKPIKLPLWTGYTTTYNKDNTPLLGAIALKEFIGIDCDIIEHYDSLLALCSTLPKASQPTYIAESLPKGSKGGHLLFGYTEDAYIQLKEISKYLKKLNIDIQIDNKLIYLATKANHTKELITEPLLDIKQLTPVPNILLNYLKGLVHNSVTEELRVSVSTTTLALPSDKHTDYYGYILSKGLDVSIVSILTPNTAIYRDITHPNQVPIGSGTDWFLQIRRKLMLDISVSPELFTNTMEYLNDLWDTPMQNSRVISDCNYDIKSSEWVYNEDWSKKGLLVYTKLTKYTLEVLYEPHQDMYILFNRTMQSSSYYKAFTSLKDAVRAQTGKQLVKEVVLTKANTVQSIDTPLEEPFLQPFTKDKQELSPLGLDLFNLFKPSEGVRLIRNPELLTDYKEPTVILDFMANLIPDKATRLKFLQFLAHKHYTYAYSPLYFVLAGVGGAGKGLLVNMILKYFSGESRLKTITLEHLSSKFNSYQLGTDYLELEEASEGYTVKENERLVGSLKRLTGNPYIQLENKGIDMGSKYRQFITPIISTNMNTKLITDTISNDRRLVLLRAPNRMDSLLPYILPNGKVVEDTGDFMQVMESELPHLACYLGKLQRSNPIVNGAYTDNKLWKGKDYYEYVMDSLSPYDKLLNACEARDLKTVKDTLMDANVSYETIDTLFSQSTKQRTFLICYANPYTRERQLLTLEDVVDSTPQLQGLVRKDFKVIKTLINVSDGTVKAKVHGIEFNTPYLPLIKTEPLYKDIKGEVNL